MKNIDNYPALTRVYATLDPEMELLLLLSRLDSDPKVSWDIPERYLRNIDWKYLCEAAVSYNVVPLVYGNLQKCHDAGVPREVFRNFRGVAAEALSGNVRLTREAVRIFSESDKSGTRILFLKGPVILADVYGAQGERSFSDIDILVKEEDSAALETVLLSLGHYRLERGGDDERYRSQTVFQNAEGLTVDVQIGPIGRNLHNRFIGFDFEEVYRRKRIIESSEGPLPTLGLEDSLIYYSLHLSMHHSFQGLRWFVDVHSFMAVHKDEIDWRQVLVLAKRYKVRRPLYYTVFFAEQLYGREVPGEIMGELEGVRREVDRYVLKKIRSGNKEVEYLSELFMFDSMADTVKFIFLNIFRYPYLVSHFFHIAHRAASALKKGKSDAEGSA